MPVNAAPAASNAGSVLPLPPDATLGGGPAIFIPSPRDTGAALFTRAGATYVVLDSAKPLDLSALRDDPVFGSIQEQTLADGVQLQLHLSASASPWMQARPGGWALVAGSTPSRALPAYNGHVRDGTLHLDADAPGHVLVLTDEPTGGRLLVGTQREPRQRSPAARLAPEFTILPSRLGLVVAPHADRVVLRAAPSGFEIAADAAPILATVWAKPEAVSWPDGRIMTRLFDLPALTDEALHRRLTEAMRAAATAPKAARFAPRMAAARAMLALGLDVEAAAVLHTATADDPAHLDDPAVSGLTAVANWLVAKAGGAPAPPPVFDLSHLGSSDEAALWRALLQPGTPDAGAQAAVLAAVWPLILDYPRALQRPLLLGASELLAAGGQTKALAALLSATNTPALNIARAGLLRAQGKTQEALALLDQVAHRPDRLASADARRCAVELRLAAHTISAAAAADALDGQLYAWRGGDREQDLRLRIAELRAQAGAWRTALAGLRRGEHFFPDAREKFRAAEKRIVADLLTGDRTSYISGFELVTLADEAADLFSSDTERKLGPALVEKLLALDLPQRAEPILRKLYEGTPNQASKAEFGLGLASLVADRGDAGTALALLDPAMDANLPATLVGRRAILRAQLLAKDGKTSEALAALAGQTDPQAIDLRIALLERRQEWQAANTLLTEALHQPDFAARPEADQRATILRLARDESAAGDLAGLSALRSAYAARFASGDGAQLFTTLTADPVRSAADLARSGQELAALRALPAALAPPKHSF